MFKCWDFPSGNAQFTSEVGWRGGGIAEWAIHLAIGNYYSGKNCEHATETSARLKKQLCRQFFILFDSVKSPD